MTDFKIRCSKCGEWCRSASHLFYHDCIDPPYEGEDDYDPEGEEDMICDKCGTAYYDHWSMPEIKCPRCKEENIMHCPSCHGVQMYNCMTAEPVTCSGCGNNPSDRQAAGSQESTPVDLINHPPHYTSHPSGVECIEICRELGFDLGNAFKYVWRHEYKEEKVALEKAMWYLKDAHGREAPIMLVDLSDMMYKVLIFESSTLKGRTLYHIYKAATREGHERDSWIEEATYTLREMIDAYTQTTPR